MGGHKEKETEKDGEREGEREREREKEGSGKLGIERQRGQKEGE